MLSETLKSLGCAGSGNEALTEGVGEKGTMYEPTGKGRVVGLVQFPLEIYKATCVSCR